eukprot:scaffold305_cov247-Pinguiococcus_pyrenoidosus.AAC.31
MMISGARGCHKDSLRTRSAAGDTKHSIQVIFRKLVFRTPLPKRFSQSYAVSNRKSCNSGKFAKSSTSSAPTYNPSSSGSPSSDSKSSPDKNSLRSSFDVSDFSDGAELGRSSVENMSSSV